MPLTPLQKDVLAVLARNRSEESHFAGGIVLNAADDSARYSHDFDIFHELAREAMCASEHDVEAMRQAGRGSRGPVGRRFAVLSPSVL